MPDLTPAQREHLRARRRMTGRNLPELIEYGAENIPKLPELAREIGRMLAEKRGEIAGAIRTRPVVAPAVSPGTKFRTNAEIHAEIDRLQARIDELAANRKRRADTAAAR